MTASRANNENIETNNNISSNFFSNIVNGCGYISNITASISLEDLLEIVAVEPCVSAISLVTLLEIDDKFPLPVNFDDQEELLSEVSEQIVISFQVWDPLNRRFLINRVNSGS